MTQYYLSDIYIYISCIIAYCLYQCYRIRENIHGRKLLHFEWKIAIHGKTFTVAFLWTYIADQQGHDLQENIHG